MTNPALNTDNISDILVFKILYFHNINKAKKGAKLRVKIYQNLFLTRSFDYVHRNSSTYL